MSYLSEDQARALQHLANLWRETRFCLIGASALACQIDLPRQTADLDITVSVSLDALEPGLQRLEGWRRHTRSEHGWFSPAGVRVDILPAGPSHLAAGEIVWPGTGARMSLAGLRLALATGEPLEVHPGLRFPVAPVPVIALLKRVSYLDRPAERERDLHDLAHVLEGYVPPEETRRFAPRVLDAEVSFEHASSYLLGLDLSQMVDDTERETVEEFVSRVRDERHASGAQGRMASLWTPLVETRP
jgi:predicted nucleotidyltransferase